MIAENERAIATATAFLRAQAERLQFGEATITLVLHDGRVTRLTKQIVEKEKAGT